MRLVNNVPRMAGRHVKVAMRRTTWTRFQTHVARNSVSVTTAKLPPALIVKTKVLSSATVATTATSLRMLVTASRSSAIATMETGQRAQIATTTVMLNARRATTDFTRTLTMRVFRQYASAWVALHQLVPHVCTTMMWRATPVISATTNSQERNVS